MKKYILLCVFSAMAGAGLTHHYADQPRRWFAAAAAAPQEDDLQVAARGTPEPDPQQFTPEELTNIRVYDQANRSVVNISTRSMQYDRFFMLEAPAEGTGSGAVLDEQGHILTNFHVVDGADEVEVTLASGNSYPAKVVGSDRTDDLAILKVDAPGEQLNPVTLGSSTGLRVGQRVYAIGNPFGWERTLTTGIISSLNRTLPSRTKYRTMKALIQTDAAMNPGNSGGPLLDTRGRMVGMNVAIETGGARQNSGVGFAIPVNRIKRVLRDLIDNGKVTRADAGIIAVLPVERGLLIGRLARGGPAEAAGLRPIRIVRQTRRQGYRIYTSESIDVSSADLILAVDGQPVRTASEFVEVVESHAPGETIKFTVIREGRKLQIPVDLGAS